VRELKNVVERLVVTVDEETIREEHLPTTSTAARRSALPAAAHERRTQGDEASLHERASGELERAFVLDALRRSHWNVSRAARETGILRPNFHALMRQHRHPRGHVD
jgi:DNA-binding NtrC family response regulator